jgi:hypothetical protein
MEASAPPSVPHVPHDPALFARGKPQVWEAGDRGSLPLPSIEDARAVCLLWLSVTEKFYLSTFFIISISTFYSGFTHSIFPLLS